MGAMHLPIFKNILLVATFILFAYEFIIGIFLIFGCFRRSTPIFAILFMSVMLPLTLWIALSNPVEDCGCFGDAIILSNWATFWKNVVLTGAVVWLFKFNATQRCLITPALQWVGLITSAGYIVIIGLAGYIYQPLIDFRPYKIGTPIIDKSDEDKDDYDAPIFEFIYEKNGEQKRFGINDEIPSEEDGWTFIRRIKIGNNLSTPNSKSENEEERNLRIWSEDGEEDMSGEVILEDGRQLILLMPELRNVSVASTWQINSLYSWAEKNSIEMIAIVAATQDEIANWRDLSLADYPLYTADDTQIKMIARGNPAVVYIENGNIIWKTSLRALGTKDFLSKTASSNPKDYGRNDKRLLMNMTGIYVAIIVILLALSLIPALTSLLHRQSAKTNPKQIP